MAQIFISYATADQETVAAVVGWLQDQGYDFFQSGHAESGIPIGAEWEKTLYWELAACRVFMPLLSPKWLESDWCHAELRIAKSRGKTIMPVKLAACDAAGVSAELQSAQLYMNADDARRRLDLSLRSHLHRRGGLLRPGQPLFPGLTAFSEAFAPVFFGRDADLGRLIEALRRAANAPVREGRSVILTGPSGVGKSSLVRAGLIPDLAADAPGDGFLVLGPIRSRDGIDGGPESLTQAIGRLLAGSTALESELLAGLAQARALIDGALDVALARNLRDLVSARGRRSLLVFVDQAEELGAEPALVNSLKVLLRWSELPAVALFATRQDAANAVRASFVGDDPVQLLPLSREGLGEAIRGPLQLVGKLYDEAFVDEMLHDAETGADPMPLMAQVLALMEKQGQGFTTSAYEAAGRLAGAIERAAETALAATAPGAEAEVRRVFVPGLAEPSLTGEVRLGRLPLSRVEPRARPLIERFVQDRLFREGVDREGQAYVESAHEALLRGWPRLAEWIEAERESLIVLGQARRDAEDWLASDRHDDRLLHRGDRLARALALGSAPGFAEKLSVDVAAYLDACADREAADVAERQAQERIVARRTALIFAAEATKASDVGLYDRALRFGLSSWCALPESVPELEAELARAAFASRQLARLEHGDVVFMASVSPDGRHVVTASNDKTARVWDAASGREAARLQHDDFVTYAAFAPGGERVVTASGDRTARIWDVAGGDEIARLEHQGHVLSAVFSPEGGQVVTASQDSTARMWDASTGGEITRLSHGPGPVFSAAFSPDGARIVTAAWDKTARTWDAASGRELTRLNHTMQVKSAAFSPDGARIITASWDRTARIWNAASGHELARLPHDGSVECALFSPDGARVITASGDKTARVWEAATGKEIARLEHEDTLSVAAFSPDGSRLVTASRDKTARVWDADSGREIARLEHENIVQSAIFSPAGTGVVTASWDKAARVWPARGPEVARLNHQHSVFSVAISRAGLVITWSGTAVRVLDPAIGREIALMEHQREVCSAVFSPDGSQVLTASRDGTARVWEAVSGREIRRMKHRKGVTFAAFSADGSRIVTASEDEMARVWDAARAREIAHLRHENGVSSAAFSPDGAWLVTVPTSLRAEIEIDEPPGMRMARVWAIDRGREIARLEHQDQVNCAAFSPDGSWVVTASDDTTACVWEAASGREVARLNHLTAVTSAAFSPDGARVVTVSGDYSVRAWEARVWDAASGREVALLEHQGDVRSAAFSRDGGRVVTASHDKTARVWDADSGREIARFRHDGAVLAAVLSADGALIATASADKTARVWDARFASALRGRALVEAICHEKLVGAASFVPDDLRGSFLPDPPQNPVKACLALLRQTAGAPEAVWVGA